MERTFTLSIPARMRIDNAANIYPASLSRHYASLYRMSVTLTEPVDPTVLQQALETVSERIPTFRRSSPPRRSAGSISATTAVSCTR